MKNKQGMSSLLPMTSTKSLPGLCPVAMWFDLIWLSALKGAHSHRVPEIKKTQNIITFYVNLPGAAGLEL
jgi:hypothetical protein